MLLYKTKEEIELIRKSSCLVTETLAEVARHIGPGVATLYIDRIAEEFIRDHGAKPGFKGYNNFPNTLCISVNNEVVHGIPSSYQLKEGDIVSVDCGVVLNGFYGDMAYTFPVGKIHQTKKKLLKYTLDALYKGVEKAVVGNRLGDIGHAVQQHAESGGFSVVREMVGHGLGKNLHEPPEVPNYGKRGKGILLKEGLVICIEPMINLGTRNIIQEKDGWTIKTLDGEPSAHFEFTVAINYKKPDVLSTFDVIEEVLKTKKE